VERVVAVEPDPVARVAAAESAAVAAVPIDVVEGFAERLPVEDGVFDAVVCIWVLCSVPDVAAAPEAAIRASGFEFDRIERGFQSSSLLTITAAPYILGVARATGMG
jgi:hypothetical protein